MFSRKGNKTNKDTTRTIEETELRAGLEQMEIDGQKVKPSATRRGGGFKDLTDEELLDVISVLSRNSPMERIFGTKVEHQSG